jgi:hypothetical protein
MVIEKTSRAFATAYRNDACLLQATDDGLIFSISFPENIAHHPDGVFI